MKNRKTFLTKILVFAIAGLFGVNSSATASAVTPSSAVVQSRTAAPTRVTPASTPPAAAHTPTPTAASESRTTTASPSSWEQKGKMRSGTQQTYAESRIVTSGSSVLAGMDGVSMTTSRVTTALSGLDHIGSAGSRNATWHASVATQQAVGTTNATRIAIDLNQFGWDFEEKPLVIKTQNISKFCVYIWRIKPQMILFMHGPH